MSKTLAAVMIVPALIVLLIPLGFASLILAGNSISMNPTFALILAGTAVGGVTTLIQCARTLLRKR